MKRNKMTRILALGLGLALTLTACGGGSTAETKAAETTAAAGGQAAETKAAEEAQAAPAAEYKDTLNIATTAQPPTLDSMTSSSNVADGIAMHIFEALYMMDNTYTPQPVLAESCEISDDGLVYTFKLREGVKFHNGKELTAEDVVASMNRWLQASAKAKAILGTSVFEEVDTYTVKMTVEHAASDILILLAAPSQFAAISPKEIVEAVGPEGIKEYIGTGPYKLEEWKQDQYIHLVKNDDYQSPEGETSGFAGKRDAYTQNIYFRFVSDDATRIAGIQTGEYDVAESIPLERYDEVAAMQGVKVYSKTGGTLTLFINTSQGVMVNEDLRQAALAAMNMEEIMLGSYGNPDLFILDPGYMNLQQEQWAVKSGEENYNQANPDKAKELLTKAGYNGEKIRLVTTPDYQEMYNATLVVQEQLRQVGFNAEVETYDFPVFMEHRSDPAQWDIYITSNSYQLLPSQLSVVNPGWAGLDVKEVSDGVDSIRYAANEAEAKTNWEKLQGFLYEYGAASVLGHYSGVIAISDKMENFENFHYPVYWNVKIAK